MAHFLIIVPVPEVEPHVARLRERFDPSSKRGLIAHITLLHSNMPSERMDTLAVEQIRAVSSSIIPFDYRITRVARFPRTLYLAAEPAGPFVFLKHSLAAALRIQELDQGSQEPLIPHVSVVRKSGSDDGEVEAELETMLERFGPISCVCKEIALLENSSGRWRPVQQFVLAGCAGKPTPDPPDR